MTYRYTVAAALIFALISPAIADAAAIPSTAPAATVARDQKEVLVMDFSLPAYAGDTIVDADGSVTEDVGVTLVQAGAPLHNIPSSARLAYGIGGQSDPKSIWIDRDGSRRYTPNFSADTTVAQPDVFGIPFPDGDVGAPVKAGGMGNLKILVSNPAELNTWHPTDSDALYKDNGIMVNLIDSEDVRVSASVRFKQQSALVPGKAMILLRAAGNACPTGIAPEDFVNIIGKPNIAVKDVIYGHETRACIAQVVLYTNAYSYSIEDQFQLVTPYVGELNIADLKDNDDNGVPDAQTKNIKVLTGTLKGIAAGDTIRIARGARTIDFYVRELSSVTKLLTVSYINGTLEGPPGDPYGVAVIVQSNHNSKLTGLLSELPDWVKYADDDADNAWDANEPLYSDEDGNGAASKNDKRLTGVTAEKRLLKKQGAVDILGGVYVDSATMAAPKWLSQLNPWADGVDVVIDHDNDGFYNLDKLRSIKISNQGTATNADISRVDLWMEDSGMAGFQGSFTDQSSDLLIGSFAYDANARQWIIANMDQPLITAERFYITANVTENAGDQRTMRFLITKDGIGTLHRTLPDAASVNSNLQTISAAAQLPAGQQGAAADISAQNSIVRVVDSLTAIANGTSVSTIEVEVRDTNNQPMANKTVQVERLRAAEDNVLATEQKVTNALGIASFTESSLEAGVFRFRGRVGGLLLGNVSITFMPVGNAVEPPAPSPVNNAGLVDGDLFMSASAGKGGTVYYYANSKKYPFPNEKVYLSWYPDFNSVTIKKIAAVDVGEVAWGTNVRYRPGTRMVKVPDDLKVYAVTTGGKVCWVKDEDVAKKFYGATWNKKIDDLLASLFVGTYRNDPTCDLTLNSKYPTGTILSVNNKNYYVDGARVRLIDGATWTSNRFRNEFALSVSSFDGYEAGPPVNSGEFSRVVD